MRARPIAAFAALLVASNAAPVRADNCGTLSDCLPTVDGAVLVAVAIGLVLGVFLLWWLLPEIFVAAEVGEEVLATGELLESGELGAEAAVEAEATADADAAAARLAARTGRAPEFAAGEVSESGFLRSAEEYLGPGYREESAGRWVSQDGMRQVRLGSHELRDPANFHAHFEAYDTPASAGGRVIENSSVKIVPDP